MSSNDQEFLQGLYHSNQINFQTAHQRIRWNSGTEFQHQMTNQSTLVCLIMMGYIVAGKNNGGYKYGGIAEKPPNLTSHYFQ